MAKRQIIRIDEELCDGCGLCVPSCAEGAIEVVDGKARLVAERYCDGLGACLGECPRGALTIEEREAEEFQGPAPWATGQHTLESASPAASEHSAPEPQAFVCPGSLAQQFQPVATASAAPSALSHWPIKLRLVAPKSPFLKNAELLVAADCAPFAAGDFHAKYLSGKALVCGCPKFDDLGEYTARLTAILKENDLHGIDIVNMEVPCCSGLVQAVRQALAQSGKSLPVTITTINATGQVVQQAKIKGK